MKGTTTMDDHHVPPGPRGLPVVGNTLEFARGPLQFVTRLQRTYGDVATFYFRHRPVVLCSRPEHVRFFLVENATRFTPVGVAPTLSEVLGEGLLTTDGEFHHRQRRLIQPAFHRRRVEGYAAPMVADTEAMLDRWKPGDEIDFARAMSQLTLRIVVRALFNVNVEAEAIGQELSQAFYELIHYAPQANLPLQRLRRLDLPFTGYHKHLAGLHALDAYIYGLIARRRAEGRDTGDILSWLLAAAEEGMTLTDKQIRDQTMTFFSAGHETTANALTWTFYLLAQHAEVRERLLAELREMLGDRPPTAADLERLPYLDWVVTESMRLYPPAWIQGRIALEPFELDGYRFPAGQSVVFSQWVIHRRPDIWGDADAFRPERWNPAGGAEIPHRAYFPFGAGPRSCIGMPFAQIEARLLTTTILRRFTPRLVPGHPVVPLPRITLRTKYGMRVILEPTPASCVTRHASLVTDHASRMTRRQSV